MDKRAKKAICKNRVRILALDYFDLTGPLLASDILPIKKHKDIKTEAPTNKARIDLLLEWIDENAPIEAFQPFLQGIRNCQENVLAKKIKKEATDGGMEMPKKPPGLAAGSQIKIHKPPTSFLPGLPIFPPGPISLDRLKIKTPKPKKPKVDIKPEVSGLGTLTLPFNGLGGLLPTPLLPPTGVINLGTPNQSRKRKSGAGDKPKTPKPKTPGNLNGTPKASGGGDDTKVVTKSAPTIKIEPKKGGGAKIKLPRVTRKSSTEKGDDKKPKAGTAGKKKPETSVAGSSGGAPKSPKAIGKAKVMTFKQVETKQQDSRQKFRFKNNDAVVKILHFKDKTDISYLGCPFEEGSTKVCEKKVELKSKEFVCDSRHKSPNCKQIPRLYITCNDGTADLQLTLLKKDVENFCGISAVELGTLSINDIKEALDKTVGKKYEVEVHCEKAKKAAKKSGIPKWNNLATISGFDDASPAKKKRKN